MILILLLYLLFASTFTLGKAVLTYLSPTLFIGIRMTIGGIILLTYQYFLNRDSWKLCRRDLFLYLQIMLFHIYIAYTVEFWALQYLSSSKACLLYSLSPFLTALFSYFLLSERMSSKKWLGLLLGFSGFLPILLAPAPIEEEIGGFSFLSYPESALFISVSSAVYGWIVFKSLLRDKAYSPIMINGIAMLGGGMLALMTSFAVDGVPRVASAPTDGLGFFLRSHLGTDQAASLAAAFLYTVALIIISNIMCYNLYGFLLRRYSATFLSFAGFTTPLFAGLFGWLLLDEQEIFSWSFLMTVTVVFLGLYIFYQEELKNNRL